jgi:DNA-binding CsgD family transcriptional regulator
MLSSSYQHPTKPSVLPTEFSDYQKKYLTNKFKLSKRELNCLELYVYGKTAKEISRMLYLSHRTIENYIQSVKIKMQAPRKSDLIHKTLVLFC